MLRLPALVTLLAAVAAPALAQTVLRPGQTVQGELSTSDSTLGDGSYFDCFTIQTRPGQTLQIDQTSDAFDSYLQVGTGGCSATLTNLVSDDDSGGGSNARLRIDGDGGMLTVRANSYSEGMTGRYTLRVAEIGQSSGGGRDAMPSRAAAPAGDPFDTPAVFVASNPDYVYFGLPIAVQADGLRLFPILQMLKTERSMGRRADGSEVVIDATVTRYTVDCANSVSRRTAVTGYLGRDRVADTPIDDPFSTPTPGTIGAQVFMVACHSDQYDWQAGFTDHAAKLARLRAQN